MLSEFKTVTFTFPSLSTSFYLPSYLGAGAANLKGKDLPEGLRALAISD